MATLESMEGSERGRHGRTMNAFGHGSSVVLALVFLALNVTATIQLDFWQNYFFFDSYRPAETCSLQVAPSASEVWNPDVFDQVRTETLAVPHPTVPVLPKERRAFTQARYHCEFSTQAIPKGPGVVNLHLGWVFGEHNRVLIDGVEKASFVGSDKVTLPMAASELAKPSIALDVEIVAKGDYFGLRGYAPAVFTEGNQKNAKVMGLELALQQIRYLYGILPVLSVGILFILGWLSGIRSRLLATLLFYFTMITLRNLTVLFADLWPWDILSTYQVVRAFYAGSYAAFCILLMEFLRVGVKLIQPLMIWTVALVVPMVALLFYGAANNDVSTWIDRLNGAVFPLLMLSLAYRSRRSQAGLAPERRRVNNVLRAVVAVFALLTIIDLVLTELGLSIRLSNKIDIVMPLFIGGVVLYALSLIQREYQKEKAKREKIERDLELAREIQDSLAPPENYTKHGRFAVRCFHEKHDAVAGDWMAIQAYGPEKLIAVIADATGKGLQAALVIHALQSLWAEHREHLHEYPDLWLEKVNLTLRILGERRAHSLTIGLACLEPGKVTYWSAGHLPLYVVTTQADGKEKVVPLAARGNVLGISEGLNLKPSSITFDPGTHVDLLVASDGVLDKGSRTSARDILSLKRRITDNALNLKTDCKAEDDKSLVHIKLDAA